MSNCKKESCHDLHNSDDNHGHEHNHEHSHDIDLTFQEIIKEITPALVSFTLLFTGIIMEYMKVGFFQTQIIQIIWYGIPFIIIALPVVKEAVTLMIKDKDFFNELSLMSFATLGAFVIGEYAEGLGVMVFYSIGEVVQGFAVSKSKKNIKALLDVRPDLAYLVKDDGIHDVDPKDVAINDIIEVRTGEKIPLDGVLITETASFNTAALTGESVPRNLKSSEEVLAGMISVEKTVRIQVTKIYSNSTLARILKMVEEGVEKKSPTEQFIRKFARVYTPIVFGLAVSVVIIPIFVLGNDYVFLDWFYKALVFLVVSCPCALVISVPLGYFGGIGLGSKNGILFKGGNYIEAMTHLKTLVTDKTGTITKGVFTVQKIISENENQLLQYLGAIEKHSTHPIAKAIVEYITPKNLETIVLHEVVDIAGKGVKAEFNGQILIAGNNKIMLDHNITVTPELLTYASTVVFVALDTKFLGAVVVADEIKEDAWLAIQQLHQLNINTIMLSGDNKDIVAEVAKELSIDEAYGELLPDGKVHFFEKLKLKKKAKDIIAFVGDGINDAPVLAMSDVGIAMGGLGSDLAIETADIIIQNDEPSKIPLAVRIAKATRSIVIQNIVLSMSVKILVLILGIYGLAAMWEAIFADVGVSLLAILNSSRLLYKKFD
ncbi:MAG: cadmium-translocating P-type ATPase [Spirochaetota bacterium]|nr:cadmium-translocating P-type ATPase [Spirochaetota bacterium]